MGAFLKVENPGVANPELFTLMGASTKRGSSNDNIVGKFGSGMKRSITLCLRHGAAPICFPGLLKMEFGTRVQTINDGMRDNVFNRVFVKYSGKGPDGKSKNSTEDLGFVLEDGATDWDCIDMAIREVVSNAIDRSVEEAEFNWVKANSDGDLEEYRKTATAYKDVVVEVVGEEKVRAKAGCTRIFIPLTPEVLTFYNQLGKWFLHFSEPENLNVPILPKMNRNLKPGQEVAVAYRRGVRIREFEASDIPSLFDYNIKDLTLDEARKASDWSIQYEAAKALANADKPSLVTMWKEMSKGKRYWENGLDSFGLANMVHDPKCKARWTESFKEAIGEDSLISAATAEAKTAHEKGHKVLVVPEEFAKAAAKYGIKTPEAVLTADQREGREVLEPTPVAKEAVDKAWDLFQRYKMTNGRAKPAVKVYVKNVEAGMISMGFYRDNTVYIHRDLASGTGVSKALFSTVLEECAHHSTQAGDFTRDMQCFTFDLVANMALAPQGEERGIVNEYFMSAV